MNKILTPSIKHENHSAVIRNINSLIDEWLEWQKEVAEIVDQPYERNTQLDVFADGAEMMARHEQLQAKTLTYLNNTVANHGFISGLDGSHCDSTDLRLRFRVQHRIQELRVLVSCLKGAEMEDRTVSMTIEENGIWKYINKEYSESKRAFGKKINFIKDSYTRKVIFRDVAHAFYLAHNGFSKPAVILAGSVIEELLRQYLVSKGHRNTGNSFNDYINKCDVLGLLKSAIHKLSDSVREFRNIVHIQKETSKRFTISTATAKAAVASIFMIANDFT